MRNTKQRQVTQRLGAVQRRVERWRKRGGGKGSRMPAELWQSDTPSDSPGDGQDEEGAGAKPGPAGEQDA